MKKLLAITVAVIFLGCLYGESLAAKSSGGSRSSSSSSRSSGGWSGSSSGSKSSSGSSSSSSSSSKSSGGWTGSSSGSKPGSSSSSGTTGQSGSSATKSDSPGSKSSSGWTGSSGSAQKQADGSGAASSGQRSSFGQQAGQAASARQSALAHDNFTKKGNAVPTGTIPQGQTPQSRWGSKTYGSADDYHRGQVNYYTTYNYAPPPYAYRTFPSFGIWSGIGLFFLLDHLTNPAHAATFYHHQNDPGFQAWRTEADKMAQENQELKAKLADLDARVKAMEGTPVNANYLPPDLPPEVALAQDQVVTGQGGSKGSWWPWIVALLGLVVVVGFIMSRRRR